MFCKKYFASYQGHVFSFSYAKHVLKMGISSWGQLSNAAISEEKSLRFIAHNFLSLWGINKCVLKKSFFLSRPGPPLSVNLQGIEPFPSLTGCCWQTFDFLSKSSRRTWVVVEGTGIWKSCLLLCGFSTATKLRSPRKTASGFFFYMFFSLMSLMEACSKQSLPVSSEVTFPSDGVGLRMFHKVGVLRSTQC